MPTLRATDPDTKATVQFNWTGDKNPTNADIQKIFQEHHEKSKAAVDAVANKPLKLGPLEQFMQDNPSVGQTIDKIHPYLEMADPVLNTLKTAEGIYRMGGSGKRLPQSVADVVAPASIDPAYQESRKQPIQHKFLGGLGELGQGVMGLGALALPGAAVSAAIPTGLGLAGGYAATKGADYLLSQYGKNLSPEVKELLSQGAGLVGGGVSAHLAPKGSIVRSPPIAEAEAPPEVPPRVPLWKQGAAPPDQVQSPGFVGPLQQPQLPSGRVPGSIANVSASANVPIKPPLWQGITDQAPQQVTPPGPMQAIGGALPSGKIPGPAPERPVSLPAPVSPVWKGITDTPQEPQGQGFVGPVQKPQLPSGKIPGSIANQVTSQVTSPIRPEALATKELPVTKPQTPLRPQTPTELTYPEESGVTRKSRESRAKAKEAEIPISEEEQRQYADFMGEVGKYTKGRKTVSLIPGVIEKAKAIGMSPSDLAENLKMHGWDPMNVDLAIKRGFGSERGSFKLGDLFDEEDPVESFKKAFRSFEYGGPHDEAAIEAQREQNKADWGDYPKEPWVGPPRKPAYGLTEPVSKEDVIRQEKEVRPELKEPSYKTPADHDIMTPEQVRAAERKVLPDVTEDQWKKRTETDAKQNLELAERIAVTQAAPREWKKMFGSERGSLKVGGKDKETMTDYTGAASGRFMRGVNYLRSTDQVLGSNPVTKPIVDLVKESYYGPNGEQAFKYDTFKGLRETSKGFKGNERELYDAMNGKPSQDPATNELAKNWLKVMNKTYYDMVNSGSIKPLPNPPRFMNDYVGNIMKDNTFGQIFKEEFAHLLDKSDLNLKDRLFGSKELESAKGEGSGLTRFNSGVGSSAVREGADPVGNTLMKDPGLIMRRYVDAAARIKFRKPMLAKANELMKNIPDDTFNKKLAEGYINDNVGVYSKEHPASEAYHMVDRKLASAAAKSTLGLSSRLQVAHGLRLFLQGLPELGLKNSAKGGLEFLKNPQKSYEQAVRSGLIDSGITGFLPNKFDTGWETADHVLNMFDLGNSFAKSVMLEGNRAKLREAGDPKWEQNAIYETARQEGLVNRTSPIPAMDKLSRTLMQWQTYKIKYGENVANAFIKMVMEKDPESFRKLAYYAGTLYTVKKLTEHSYPGLSHIGGHDFLRAGITPQLKGMFDFAKYANNGDWGAAAVALGRVLVPLGTRISSQDSEGNLQVDPSRIWDIKPAPEDDMVDESEVEK